jgi:hypothetical protein
MPGVMHIKMPSTEKHPEQVLKSCELTLARHRETGAPCTAILGYNEVIYFIPGEGNGGISYSGLDHFNHYYEVVRPYKVEERLVVSAQSC